MTAKQMCKRLDPAVRAEQILGVALRLFAERNYAPVSMCDIAEACGINAGLIYYYYDSKDELLRRALAVPLPLCSQATASVRISTPRSNWWPGYACMC